jgi:hypothetical protein
MRRPEKPGIQHLVFTPKVRKTQKEQSLRQPPPPSFVCEWRLCGTWALFPIFSQREPHWNYALNAFNACGFHIVYTLLDKTQEYISLTRSHFLEHFQVVACSIAPSELARGELV